jgi:hypothetical protein
MESSSVSASARVVLWGLIGLLFAILGFLIAFAVLLRRRPVVPVGADRRGVARDPEPMAAELDPLPADFAAAPELAVMMDSGAQEVALDAGGGSQLSCPTCRRNYDGAVFCPHDARRLVPRSRMRHLGRASGVMCPRCRRAFDPGVRFCPHDATELVPLSIVDAARAPRAPTGIMAKICPQCRGRYDLAATFCDQDGAELRTVN